MLQRHSTSFGVPALYPTLSMAATMRSRETLPASNVTSAVRFSRLTSTFDTPVSDLRAFLTVAAHATQTMPSTGITAVFKPCLFSAAVAVKSGLGSHTGEASDTATTAKTNNRRCRHENTFERWAEFTMSSSVVVIKHIRAL